MLKRRSIPLSLSNQILFWTHLVQLQRAHIPLMESIIWVRELPHLRKWKTRLQDISQDLIEGYEFSAALKRSKMISQELLALVLIAEITGDYIPFFQQILKQLKYREQLEMFLKRELRYPGILLVVLVILLVLVITIMVPMLHYHLQTMGIKTLPSSTLMLLKSCKLLGFTVIAILCVNGVAFILFQMFKRKFNWLEITLSKLFLELPLLGRVIFEFELIKFTQSFAFLLNARVNLLSALFHAAYTVKNKLLRQQLLDIELQLIKGISLSRAFTSIISEKTLLSQFITLGEKTGNLSEILRDYSDLELEKLKEVLRRYLGLLQPALVIIMGAILMFIVITLLWPMYSLVSQYAI